MGGKANFPENISAYLVGHFSALFTSTCPILDNSLDDLIEVVSTDEENVDMCSIPEESEISWPSPILVLTKPQVLMG